MLKLKRIEFQKSYQILAKDDLSTFKKSMKKKDITKLAPV